MEYLSIAGMIVLVWLAPVTLTAVVNALYKPRAHLIRIGARQTIRRCVLIFYQYHHQVRSVREADICPLCKRRNMRCRVTINPLSGMRVHTSLNRRRLPAIGKEFVRVNR